MISQISRSVKSFRSCSSRNRLAGFTVYGVPLAEDTALLDTGIDLALGPRTTAGVSYSGQSGDGVSDNGIKGRFTWLF